MTDIINIVTQKLESYLLLKKRLKLLDFELTHRAKITPEEMLACMAYPQQGSGIPVKTSNYTDKTADIASSYREASKRVNEDIVAEIVREQYAIVVEVTRMEFYTTFLTDELAEIVRLHYFEGTSWKEIQERKQCSERTLNRRRREAIAEMAELYRISGVLQTSNQ